MDGGGAPHHPCIIFGETRERRVLTLHFHGHAASRDSLQLCLAILCIACAPSLQHPSLVSPPSDRMAGWCEVWSTVSGRGKGAGLAN